MRRDVCFFFPADVATVYNGYLTAAKSAPFDRTCKEEPYYRIQFGVNYSFKYNMNGGSCTIHFIPWKDGTAVNLRFSIAQLMGARYEKYADDLTEQAERRLGMRGRTRNVDVELFTDSRNWVLPQQVQQPRPAAPAPTPAPVPSAVPSAGKTCTNCGHVVMDADAAFCGRCGTAFAKKARFCGACGAQAPADAAFCQACGKKL